MQILKVAKWNCITCTQIKLISDNNKKTNNFNSRIIGSGCVFWPMLRFHRHSIGQYCSPKLTLNRLVMIVNTLRHWLLCCTSRRLSTSTIWLKSWRSRFERRTQNTFKLGEPSKTWRNRLGHQKICVYHMAASNWGSAVICNLLKWIIMEF